MRRFGRNMLNKAKKIPEHFGFPWQNRSENSCQINRNKIRAQLFLLLFILLLPACSVSTPVPTATIEQSAWTACTLFIERQLDISYLDAQNYTASSLITLADDQYIVEVFYADLGEIYRCQLLRRTDGTWELLKLEEKES